ncbi:MAG TPA: response regulator [Victivallales bacterium]|nr:response regulator [Victivallales bacterium]HPO90482.1 response regulator [Victivallales bacterium]HRR06221.1 response regulator [Victivallales bacterium]HRU01217.1 response regulator [Victivallales bacterium]
MILLFEDNYDLAYVMKRILANTLGMACIICSKESDAETEVFSGNVDMIISDLKIFERIEGLEFIKKIRHIMPFTCPPIVVYTGLDRESKEYKEAVKFSDAVYEKGEISIIELCLRIKKIFYSDYCCLSKTK